MVSTRDVMLDQSALDIRRKSFKLSRAVETAATTSTHQDAVLQVSQAVRRIAGSLRGSCREGGGLSDLSETRMLLRLLG